MIFSKIETFKFEIVKILRIIIRHIFSNFLFFIEISIKTSINFSVLFSSPNIWQIFISIFFKELM